MSAKQAVPEPFRELQELTADALGSFVLAASDDFFAPKESLLKPNAPEWREGEYTERGKWMDGWESQRRRSEGHDFAVIRLGAPGRVRGVLVDTTHFKGNAPQTIALDGVEAPLHATPAELLALPSWTELVPPSPVKPDFPNLFFLTGPGARPGATSGPRVTHLRLRIYPDGGVARLRAYGDVIPDEALFWGEASVDLAAVANGARIASASDSFFGPPENMLLPGRGTNMGDGWETKRRRTPGSDWAVVELARPGVVERIDLDTHFFKGNAPVATRLECLDARALDGPTLARRLRSAGADRSEGWEELLERSTVIQHHRHTFEPARPRVATHVRVHIFPHGGVNRLRLFGHAVDLANEASARERLNALGAKEAAELFRAFCGSSRWVDQLQSARPFPSLRALFSAARAAWWELGPKDWLEAFAAHPRIGDTRAKGWSKSEQRGVESAEAAVLDRLSELNRAYFDKFGFVFLICATGKSANELLAALEARLGRSREAELETAAVEQARITRLRLARWLREQNAAPAAEAGRARSDKRTGKRARRES